MPCTVNPVNLGSRFQKVQEKAPCRNTRQFDIPHISNVDPRRIQYVNPNVDETNKISLVLVDLTMA